MTDGRTNHAGRTRRLDILVSFAYAMGPHRASIVATALATALAKMGARIINIEEFGPDRIRIWYEAARKVRLAWDDSDDGPIRQAMSDLGYGRESYPEAFEELEEQEE